MPQAQTTSTAAELTQQDKDKSSFQGTFIVTMMRHLGNLRAADASAWITTINAIVQTPTADTAFGLPDNQG
jgi:hypothetical protein